MLLEWLTERFTPCPPALRRLGYGREAVAIAFRHDRHALAWAGHLAKSKTAVLDAAAACAGRARAVVLGSGSGLDLPLEDLAGQFGQLTLVDAVHPWPLRRRIRRLANAAIDQRDVTGIAVALLAAAKAGTGALSPPRPNGPGLDQPADFVVSLNLLSQLPLAPLAFAERHGLGDAAARDAWAQAIQRSHIEALLAHAGQACLIADWEQILVDRQDTEIGRNRPLDGLGLPPPAHSWAWPVAPRGELERGEALILTVGVWPDLKAAGAAAAEVGAA